MHSYNVELGSLTLHSKCIDTELWLCAPTDASGETNIQITLCKLEMCADKVLSA